MIGGFTFKSGELECIGIGALIIINMIHVQNDFMVSALVLYYKIINR